MSENMEENKDMMEAIEDREPEECPYLGCGAMLPRDVSFQELHMFRCHSWQSEANKELTQVIGTSRKKPEYTKTIFITPHGMAGRE